MATLRKDQFIMKIHNTAMSKGADFGTILARGKAAQAINTLIHINNNMRQDGTIAVEFFGVCKNGIVDLTSTAESTGTGIVDSIVIEVWLDGTTILSFLHDGVSWNPEVSDGKLIAKYGSSIVQDYSSDPDEGNGSMERVTDDAQPITYHGKLLSHYARFTLTDVADQVYAIYSFQN